MTFFDYRIKIGKLPSENEIEKWLVSNRHPQGYDAVVTAGKLSEFISSYNQKRSSVVHNKRLYYVDNYGQLYPLSIAPSYASLFGFSKNGLRILNIKKFVDSIQKLLREANNDN